MKLTRASSYALHALVFMASQKKQDRPMASHNIAALARGIPKRFLLKVLKPLVTARVLRSVKGPNGGYQLARPAHEVTLLEILEAVDGPIRGNAPLSEGSNGKVNQKLDVICQNAADHLRDHLRKIRLTELMPSGRK